MGAKRAKRRYEQQRSNIINFNTHQSKQVHILPRNKNQETYMLKLLDPRKDIVFGIGPAGTGKTLLAVQVAIKNFKDGLVDKIVITRPAVSVDEDLGFLPGTMEDKMAPWTRPIFDVFKDYYSPREVEGMIEAKNLKIHQQVSLFLKIISGAVVRLWVILEGSCLCPQEKSSSRPMF